MRKVRRQHPDKSRAHRRFYSWWNRGQRRSILPAHFRYAATTLEKRGGLNSAGRPIPAGRLVIRALTT